MLTHGMAGGGAFRTTACVLPEAAALRPLPEPVSARFRPSLRAPLVGADGGEVVGRRTPCRWLFLKYLDLGPQFDFGHGSGYTTFYHANAQVSAGGLPLAALANGEQVEVSVNVTNAGRRDGDEVVQFYVRNLVSSVAQPVRRLVAFARRHVTAGETITVSFGLGTEQLGSWDIEANPTRFTVEPGTFTLYIGGSLHSTQELTFEVV